MHFIVMGCGRVGSSVATQLADQGHSVAVIDQSPDAFRRLGPDFNGQKVKGVGFDRDVLIQAGIKDADGFAAVASGDNSNILAARTVREMFGLRNVVARIYDLKRAEVYERLGIPTVASIRWAVDQVLHEVLPEQTLSEFTDPTGGMSLFTCQVDRAWVGLTLAAIERVTESRVAFATRVGTSFLPEAATVFQEGDRLDLLAPTGRVSAVSDILAAAPKMEDN